MLRRSTDMSLATKRVGVVMGSDMRDGVVNVRCVAFGSSTSGAEASSDAVGMIWLPDAIDCRSNRRGSRSEVAIVASSLRLSAEGLGLIPRGDRKLYPPN